MIAVIAAVSENGVIGKNGSIPWHIPGDLAFFRKLTTGNTVIMGRNTYESIGHPLPGRYNIIVSSNIRISAENCITAVSRARTQDIFICGGHRLYSEAIGLADRLYITEIAAYYDGDTYFPPFDKSRYKRTVLSHTAGEIPYSFVLYELK